ncbi:MAG: nuclease-related domain-containing protein [Woeseiaceae bacterium]|jgi:hypothetical protein
MDIASISGAAAIALTSTLAFVLIAKSWQLIGRVVASSQNFSDSMMREAAQRFRSDFERLSRSQSLYLGAVLVFTMLFLAAYTLDADRLFLGYPIWQLNLLLTTLVVAALLTIYRLVRIVLNRHQVKLLRDANIAVGHHLQQMAAGLGRAYHDVETSAGIIDHLLISKYGVYAINVFAVPPKRKGVARLEGRHVRFSPGRKPQSIVAINAKVASLEREFRRRLDHRVRVRSVIAAPGWDIQSPAGQAHLLVNEKTLPMLGGWKDAADYLLAEDAAALHAMLTARCKLIPDRK